MKKVAVAGAGIGGLTAGVALRQAGFDVDIYEQALRRYEGVRRPRVTRLQENVCALTVRA